MVTNIMVSPWKGGTPRRISKALGLILRTPKEMESTPRDKHRTLINWGVSAPYTGFGRILNRAPAVASASNKLSTFRILRDAQIPTLEFTTNINEAFGWLSDTSVICHTNLHGHSGNGLVLVKKGSKSLPGAKVYTKYFPKKTESRTHVIKIGDSLIHMYLEKRRILPERYEDFGISDSPDTYIRTYENGWIFAREVTEDSHAIGIACDTLKILNLDYGAVDIMRRGGKYVVGEVNTAPGLEGQALKFYVNNLEKILGT